jgi:Yip1 domain
MSSTNPYEPPRFDDGIPHSGSAEAQGIAPNPFLSIWTKPRATIRRIVSTDCSVRVLPLAMADGVTETLARTSQLNLGERIPPSAILAIIILLGPLAGISLLYVNSWFLALSGRLLKGRANARELRAALAWSSVPSLVMLPLWLIDMALIGTELFMSESPILDSNPSFATILQASEAAALILGIWSFLILVSAVSEVQGFRSSKALESMFLALALFVIPIFLIMLVAFALSR